VVQKAADADNTGAMCGLGLLYKEGQGVAQDYERAREWYQKAANASNAMAKQFLSGLPNSRQRDAPARKEEDYLEWGRRRWQRLSRESGTRFICGVDTIEQALRCSETLHGKVGPAGYVVAYRLAEENLRLGRTVVADSVNPLNMSLGAWLAVAANASKNANVA
jgi:TPR repeat protein